MLILQLSRMTGDYLDEQTALILSLCTTQRGIQQVGDKALVVARRGMDQTDPSSGKNAGKEFPQHHWSAAWNFTDNGKRGFWLHIWDR